MASTANSRKNVARRNLSSSSSSSHSSSSRAGRSERQPLLAHDHQHLQDLEGANYTSPSPNGKPHPGDALKPKSTKDVLWAKTKYYVPVLRWLPSYKLSYLPSDALAALSVASISIPQSISFATTLARSSPIEGLFPTAIPAIIYAFLGTSRHLNVAPGAPLSLLMGQAITGALRDNPDNPSATISAVVTITTFQAGLISFLVGLFRLGFIDVILSRALMRGFMTAIAIVIMVEQLVPMLGLSKLSNQEGPQSTVEIFLFVVKYSPKNFHGLTAVVSFGAFAILFMTRQAKHRITRFSFLAHIPEVLLVVILATVLSWKLKWNDKGLGILGSVQIDYSNSLFRFPINRSTLRHFQRTTSTAVLITILGYLDSIVAAKQAATRYQYSISANRELVALGAGNIVSSFIPGSLPAYGSLTRTKLNGDVGAKTQMTSIIIAIVVLLVTFFALPWLFYLPKAILASVIFLVVLGLLSETPADIRYYWKMRAWADLAVMSITFIVAIVWNVEAGVISSMMLSLLIIVHRSSKPRLAILGHIPSRGEWKPLEESQISPEEFPGILAVQVKDDLNFTNTADIKERLTRLELFGEDASHPGEDPTRKRAAILIFDLEEVGNCDASAAQTFYELLDSYKTRGTKVFIAHLQARVRSVFERAGTVELLGDAAICDAIDDAMKRIEEAEAGAIDGVEYL